MNGSVLLMYIKHMRRVLFFLTWDNVPVNCQICKASPYKLGQILGLSKGQKGVHTIKGSTSIWSYFK